MNAFMRSRENSEIHVDHAKTYICLICLSKDRART